jgi:hypothetical protein
MLAMSRGYSGELQGVQSIFVISNIYANAAFCTRSNYGGLPMRRRAQLSMQWMSNIDRMDVMTRSFPRLRVPEIIKSG